MRLSSFLLLLFLIFSCKNPKAHIPKEDVEVVGEISLQSPIEEDTTTLANDFRAFKVLDSKYINVAELWQPLKIA